MRFAPPSPEPTPRHRRFLLPGRLPSGALLLLAGLLGLAAAGGRTASATEPLRKAGPHGRPPSEVPMLGALRKAAPRLDPEILRLALTATRCAEQRGLTEQPRTLTVIDYSLPSTERRMWVFDLGKGRRVFRELVAHGVNTGENWAREFSNRVGSRQSSLGLFRTEATYYGRNGYSLRLEGLESGINDLALERTIVVHGAWYVSEDFARRHGRLGRSWGCPALPKRVARQVIDTIKDGDLLFIYYPDEDWLDSSAFLNGCTGETPATAVAAAR